MYKLMMRSSRGLLKSNFLRDILLCLWGGGGGRRRGEEYIFLYLLAVSQSLVVERPNVEQLRVVPTLPLGSAIYLRVLRSDIVSLFSKNMKKENFNVPGLSMA